MAVDFSKAFDTVNHTTLLSDIHNTTMEHNTIRWLTTYLRGRTSTCRYNNTSSKSYIIHTGVPQGSVLSPYCSTSTCHISQNPPKLSLSRPRQSPPLRPLRPWPPRQLRWSSGRLIGIFRYLPKNPQSPSSVPKLKSGTHSQSSPSTTPHYHWRSTPKSLG